MVAARRTISKNEKAKRISRECCEAIIATILPENILSDISSEIISVFHSSRRERESRNFESKNNKSSKQKYFSIAKSRCRRSIFAMTFPHASLYSLRGRFLSPSQMPWYLFLGFLKQIGHRARYCNERSMLPRRYRLGDAVGRPTALRLCISEDTLLLPGHVIVPDARYSQSQSAILLGSANGRCFAIGVERSPDHVSLLYERRIRTHRQVSLPLFLSSLTHNQ